MPVVIGVLRETVAGERRLAVVPDVVKKLKAQGADILIETGAGAGAFFRDEDFAGASAASAQDILAKANVLLKVRPPTADEIGALQPGAVVLGFLQPYQDADRVKLLAEKKITSFAVELIPRISRAQSMDALSSQAAVSGYLCVLLAAEACPKFFPMMTYAAGTLRPAQVMVIGAGVAGLQAIATAKRLGAIVTAYDVRPETKEQIESLGAKFVDTGVSAAGSGGYARELTEEEKKQQADKLAKAVSQVDALITTAAIPGRRAPLIITEQMVRGMKAGSVVVDMAAESGGNVAGSVAGASVEVAGTVTIIGPANLPSRMPIHASEMYAKNLFNFLSPCIKDGNLALDWSDEIIAGSALTHDGQVRHEGVKKALGL
ncbi:MAG: transhydrogenase (Re/Si-specific) subunit alpha [Proteobacteria bacterium]|nr:transhydrogenase (Re/Si-specific) subunit alpha [Pseudomonadota bacterium]